MNRMLLVVALFVLVFPATLFAQCAPPPAKDADSCDESSPLAIPGLSNLCSFDLGGIICNPYAQVGFTRVGANIALPISAERVLPDPLNSLDIGTLDMWFSDFNVWQGTLGLNAILTPQISAFAMAGGVAPRTFVTPAQLPINVGNASASPTFEFTASNLEVWFIQTGASYQIGGGLAIAGGFFWDHTSIEIADPRLRGVPLANQTLRGDLVAKTRFPFVGLQFMNESCLFSLNYSPLAWADVKLAFRNSQNNFQELRYTWSTPGDYLGFYFQYNALPPPAILSVYLLGSWMNVEGGGDLEHEQAVPASIRSKDSVATMGKYSYGAGLSLGLMF
ncbi:hypothetical protein ACFL2Q_06515 [Thermodesulfobacteriota bacterium]